MRINEFITESFQTVSINGILYSLNTDEKAIYTKVKEAGKLLKKDLSEFDARVANGMVTKGLLKRRKNPQQEIYFVTKGRRKNAPEKPIEEVAPPDSQIEKWINDNKERFEEKYGKEYKKYLYGKAWNKFNGKKMVKESVEYHTNVHSTIGDIWTNKHNHNDYEVIDIDFKSLLFNGQEYKRPLYTLKNITNSVGLPSTCDNHTLLQHYFKNTDYNGGWDGEDEETNTSLQEKCLKNSKTLKESVERLDEHVHYDMHVYDIDWGTPSDRQNVEFNMDEYADPDSDDVYEAVKEQIAEEFGFYPSSFMLEVNGIYDEDGNPYGLYDEDGNPYNEDSENADERNSENDLPSDYWDGDSEEEIIESIFQEAYMQLNEGVEDVRKYFPKISDTDFSKLLKLDPTYKGGDELGKYGKWILSLYNTFLKDKESYTKWEEQKKLGNNFPEPVRKSQEKIEDFEKLYNILSDFEVMNKRLRVNINNVKSITDLYKIVSDAKNEGISNNSQVNHAIDLVKKSVEKGGKVVFKDKQWIVLIPETLESSVVFGDDTKWCTTAPNGKMYRYYKKERGGEYYINVNLQDGSLYQFHFESGQYMDKNNDSIKLGRFLNSNPSLKNFYHEKIKKLGWWEARYNLLYGELSDDEIIDIISKTTGNDLWHLWDYIPHPSDKVKLATVKHNGNIIKLIENPTEEMKLIAVKEDGNAIQYIDNPTEEMQLIAVRDRYYYFRHIKNPSEQVQLEAVKQHGGNLYYIKNPSEQVQLEAVKQCGPAIKFIDNPSEELQLIAVKQNAEAIKYIDNPTEEMQLIAVTSDKKTLKLIKNPTPAVIKAAQKRKRKSSSSMNESAGSKDSLDFYKRYEGTEVETKDNNEVFTIVHVEHDGFGIRFTLESNETDRAVIVELDEMDKYFTGFVSFEKDDTENEDYWDGEDDEDELMETVHQAKFKKGQKLIHKSSGEEWTIRHIHYEHGLGFFYEIVRPLQLSNGEMATIKYNESEKSLEKGYENMDYPDDTENEDYWDGE